MDWIISHPTSLLEALKERYPDSSNTTLRSWIQQGRLAVDGNTVRLPTQSLLIGQSLRVIPSGELPPKREGRYARIVYEDRYLTVVDKRAGALSVATPTDTVHTVHTQLKELYRPQTVFVVHRLDQGTSGLMVFARDQAVFNQLKEQLAVHAIARHYLAIVTGVPTPLVGTWQSYLSEDSNYYVHSSDNPQAGEEAITHYQTLAQQGRFTLLQVTLATGKKNQIRVHCQRAGIPVVGDDKYGGDKAALPRLALHAYALHFVHPITQQPLAFTAAAPRCFTRLIAANLWVKPPITLAAAERRHVR